LIVGILAAAAVVGSNAGARTQQLVSPTQAATPAISTQSAVTKFLHAHGIKATHVVIQNAANNYAGPSCPGITWACTTAKGKVVVQFSRRDGDNQYQCSPSTGSGGSSTPPDGCVIVQVSSGAENDATCVETSNLATGTAQNCQVFQTNTTGDNNLQIFQLVDANGGAAQSATQYAGSIQTNTGGSNNAEVHQFLGQSTHDIAADGSQSQSGNQGVSVNQTTGTGNNSARVGQSLDQRAQINVHTTGTVTQTQDSTATSPYTSAGITQTSTSGTNTAVLNQSNELDGMVSKWDNGSQTQGAPGGGLLGHFNQSSSGLSTVNGNQREHQTLRIDGDGEGFGHEDGPRLSYGLRDHHDNKGPQPGVITQTQYGPAWWGSSQFGDPNNTYDISSNSDQHAGSNANQSDKEYANCETSGVCNATQNIDQNGNHQTNMCSAPTCHVGLIVIGGVEGGTTTCSGLPEDSVDVAAATRFCPFPPSPPPLPVVPGPTCGIDCIKSTRG
jgi:hypothetical protein